MEILIAAVLVCALVWFASAPLRSGGGDGAPVAGAEAGEDPDVAELQALKEAKYRQIRDAELDREQGKLSQEDWRAADAELRREAIEILKRLDRAGRG